MRRAFGDWLRWRRHLLANWLEDLIEPIVLWTDSDPFTD